MANSGFLDVALRERMREALRADDFEADQGDAELADRARKALPALHERIVQACKEKRERVQAQAPWALVPLSWRLDLLAPLGRQRQEITHTQALAFLLDPRESHGLGSHVLREFFRYLGRIIPGEDVFEKLSREPENQELLDRFTVSAEERSVIDVIGGGRVEQEERRCDIWLELQEAERSVYVVIENKVDAAEHDDQLSAYEDLVWQRARNRGALSFEAKLVLLTPEGRQPTNVVDQRKWLTLSYTQLAAILAHACKDAPEPGLTYVRFYIATILRHVLYVPADEEGPRILRQLPFLTEVLSHRG